MRRTLVTLALVLALHRPACAEGEIAGPDVVPVYSLATVTTEVVAEGYIWLTFPPETTYEANSADPKSLQFTGTPGPHLVMLIPLKAGAPVGKYRKTVTFGPAPGPAPNPVPPGPTPIPPAPGPGLGLSAYVRDVVARAVPVADRPPGAASIAAAYREAVRLGRDGKFATPQTMVTYVREAMKVARPASWAGFLLQPKLDELARAGKLATTADLVAAFEEIAVTLEAIANGQ